MQHTHTHTLSICHLRKPFSQLSTLLRYWQGLKFQFKIALLVSWYLHCRRNSQGFPAAVVEGTTSSSNIMNKNTFLWNQTLQTFKGKGHNNLTGPSVIVIVFYSGERRNTMNTVNNNTLLLLICYECYFKLCSIQNFFFLILREFQKYRLCCCIASCCCFVSVILYVVASI